MRFENIISTSNIVLTEGGVLERVRRGASANPDPFIEHAGLIYDENGSVKPPKGGTTNWRYTFEPSFFKKLKHNFPERSNRICQSEPSKGRLGGKI